MKFEQYPYLGKIIFEKTCDMYGAKITLTKMA